MKLTQRCSAEGLGTMFLLAAVVGSGIMGERLAGGNVALALLANSLATGGALFALIVMLGPTSGAHFNPLVTVALAARGEFPWREAPAYVTAQILGALAGVVAAQAMFGLPLIEFSQKARSGMNLAFSEFIASFGLLMLILLGLRHRAAALPQAIAAWITGAYWFTSSTSFANPAVTLARTLTNSFAGIRAADAPAFVLAQIAALLAALLFNRWLLHESTAPNRA